MCADSAATDASERQVVAHDYTPPGNPRKSPCGTIGLRKLFVGQWRWWLAFAAMVAIGRLLGFPLRLLEYALIGIVAIPVALVVVAPLFAVALRKFYRLQEDVSWARWQAVLDRLPSLRTKLPPAEYAFRYAQALAGLGRLDEALDSVRPLGDGRQMPLWLYWGRVSELYATAQARDEQIACMKRAVEFAPENPTVILDLALALLRHRRDAERSRRLLEESYAKAEPFERACPLISMFLAEIHAYLALALAASGDRAAARRHYDLAEPRLRALRRDELLVRLREALEIES